jgi:hypothetical protein
MLQVTVHAALSQIRMPASSFRDAAPAVEWLCRCTSKHQDVEARKGCSGTACHELLLLTKTGKVAFAHLPAARRQPAARRADAARRKGNQHAIFPHIQLQPRAGHDRLDGAGERASALQEGQVLPRAQRGVGRLHRVRTSVKVSRAAGRAHADSHCSFAPMPAASEH